MKKLSKPTDSELEILQILWENSPRTVREVNEILNKKRETGYTTTLKFMQIMFEKGLVSREKSGKTHFYTAEVQEQDIQQALLDRFIDRVFKGSASKLMMQALGRKQASPEELKEMQEILKNLEDENKDKSDGSN
ncbi:MAG: BlaI/MecI/CopY family transcriptional regulator [Bacteroidota bacterium]